MRREDAIIIPKVWRSEIRLIIFFFVFCIASIVLSHEFPGSVIRGELFRIGSQRIMLNLPLFWFLPAGALFRGIFRIYNVQYLMDGNGIEARYGVMWVNQTISRIRYLDIRSAEIQQSITDRILSVGNVIISSAAKQSIDVVFEGVAVPQEVKEVILAERDKRQRLENIPLSHGKSSREKARA